MIVLTGLKNEVVGIQSVMAGAQDFLIKGEFDGKGLVKCIRYSLQRWKAKYAIVKQKKKIEDDLKRSDSVHQIAKFGNWEMDFVDRSMKWADEMFRIFGFQPQSFNPTLSDYLSYVHLEDRDKVDEYFDSVMQEAQQKRIEHRIIVEGTNIKHVMVHAQVSVDENSDKIYLIGGVQDITERKKYSEIVQNKNKKEQPVNLFGTVLPKLRPTVSPDLINFLTHLHDNYPSVGAVFHWKDQLRNLLQHYFHLMQSSLLNDALIKAEIKNVDLKILTKSIETLCYKLLNIKEKRLIVQFGRNFPGQIDIDPNWMLFLVHTAYLIADNQKSMDHQTTLKFEMEEAPENEQYLLMTLQGKFDKVSVISGFSEHSLLQYMERYPDKDNEILHLLTLYKVSNLMEGRCGINNISNNLMQIQLSIPINKDGSKVEQVSEEDLSGRSTTILLAEDHSINRIKIKRMLTNWSDLIEIKEAENGKKALEVFDHANVDLILMDLKMPVMDGMEAISRIRENSKTPIIALTNTISEEEKEACFLAGADLYLNKPLKPNELYDAIRSLLT